MQLPWWSVPLILVGLGLGMVILIRRLSRMESAEAEARRQRVAERLTPKGWQPAREADADWFRPAILPIGNAHRILAIHGNRTLYDAFASGQSVLGCNSERADDERVRRPTQRHTVIACQGAPAVFGWVPKRPGRRDSRHQGFYLLPNVEAPLEAALGNVIGRPDGTRRDARLADRLRRGAVGVAMHLAREDRPRTALNTQHPQRGDRVLVGASADAEPLSFYAHWLVDLLADLLDDYPNLIVECMPEGVLVTQRVDRKPDEGPADDPDLDHGWLSPQEIEDLVEIAQGVCQRLKVE